MGNRLYVANIAFSATNETLAAYFAQAGTVTDAQIVIDKDTGRSRGFAFVTMAGDADAQNAISMFHGKDFEGRPLAVSEARPRDERSSAFRGGGRGFGGGGGGRGRDRGERGPRRNSGGRRGGYDRE